MNKLDKLKTTKPLSSTERRALVKRGKPRPKPKTPEEIADNLPAEKSIDINQYIEILQKLCADEVQKIKDSDDEDSVKIPLIEAQQIWLNVTILMQSDQYKNMTDDEKIALIQRDFKDFYKNFPIISRYMICLGQYSQTAFQRMLIRCKTITELIHESNDKAEIQDEKSKKKDFNEKSWIERRADYVQFLWEDVQEGSFDPVDAKKIWNQIYEALLSEFTQFKTMHDDAEKKIKEDEIKHKKELLYEMSERLVSGKQVLANTDAHALVNKLKDIVYKQRFTNLVKQLNDVTLIEPIIEAVGCDIEARREYDDELQQSIYKKTYKKMDINKVIA